MANTEKLLNIEPHELSFPFEIMKQAFCTIRLSSNSSRHVAFKVMTTNPEKYFVRPNSGILLPRSICDVEVTMRILEDAPPNMECKDKFLIKSVLASPDDTVERARKLFNDGGRGVQDYKMRAVYVLPSHQQLSNLDRSGQGSSLHGSVLQEKSLSGTQFHNIRERLVDNLYVKLIAFLLLSLIFLYLIMRVLPVLWSWSMVVSVLVIKMAKRLFSDSVEDWIVKSFVYISLHLITLLFRRKSRKSGHDSGDSVAR